MPQTWDTIGILEKLNNLINADGDEDGAKAN